MRIAMTGQKALFKFGGFIAISKVLAKVEVPIYFPTALELLVLARFYSTPILG